MGRGTPAGPATSGCEALGPPPSSAEAIWLRTYGELAQSGSTALAVGPSCEMFIGGGFEAGGGEQVQPVRFLSGDRDIFLLGLGASGDQRFRATFGGPGWQVLQALATDALGNVLMGGTFEKSVDLGGGPLVSAGSDDLFIALLDGQGQHLWSQRLGGIDIDGLADAAFDESGAIWLIGMTTSPDLDLGGGPLPGRAGAKNPIVVKLGADGRHLTSRRFMSDEAAGLSVAAMPGGGALVTGWIRRGSIDLGDGPLADITGAHLATGAFLARLDTEGEAVWSRGISQTVAALDLRGAVDAAGNVVVAGSPWNSVDLGGGPLPRTAGYDVVVAKYDPDGAHLWSKRFGDAPGSGQSQTASDLIADPRGHLFLTGSFSGTVDFGGGPLTAAGDADAFVVELGPDGVHWAARRYGGDHAEVGFGLALRAPGQVLIGGAMAEHYDGALGFLSGAFADAFAAILQP